MFQRLLRPGAMAICLALAAASAFAGQLTLTGSNEFVLTPPAPNATNIATMLIGVDNADVGNSPFLAGWQFRLDIDGSAFGATGDLLYQAANNPGATYVMDENSSGLFSALQNSDTRVSANDVVPNPPANPTDVPATGTYFLSLIFKAGATAPSGKFGIYAVTGIGSTSWSDESYNDNLFTNVPGSGASVLIGTVTVVPEPATIGSMLAGGLLVGVLARRQLRRRKALARQ